MILRDQEAGEYLTNTGSTVVGEKALADIVKLI